MAEHPLDPITSIKVKLGLLVGASVAAAALLATIGAAAGVPPLLTLPVSVALALGVTQLLASGMTAPLREMTAAAQRMARGDYGVRVGVSGHDEVGRLAVAFNRMAADLATVDRERRDLLATVSHELRTPLTAMTAQLENLADGVVPADEQHLVEAVQQAERLRDLVSDLLDLSRLEGGVTRLDPQPVGLRALVEACAREIAAAGREARVDVRIPPALEVRADPRRLRQLVVNALDNAARHSPAGAPVVVSAAAAPEHVWLSVVDAGPGIDPERRERVFTRFGTDDTGGTGLGLAVARWVAELHGGTLRFVEPPAGGAGAHLLLTLPHTTPTRPTSRTPGAPHVQEVPMSPAPSAHAVPPLAPRPPGSASAPGGLLAALWPDRVRTGLGTVAAAAGVGVLAGAVMTFHGPGLSWLIVLVAAGAVAWAGARHRRDPFTLACTVLALLLVLPIVLLDAPWIGMLCLVAAAAVFLIGVTRARDLVGFLLSGLAWPASSLRGLPWFGRSLRLVGTGDSTPALVRTAIFSGLGLLVFGALFASADALFASWVDALLPQVTLGSLVLRGFVAVAVFGLTLAAAYLALNPPRVDVAGREAAQPLRNRFEWLAPVLLIDLVFVVFLLAQATAFFGGHDYVEATTGLTYADYVHQGFGQLTVATALTLLVMWAASRRAGEEPADRLWLRVSLGLLGVLTLVVVGSALQRMSLYQEAYGFTSLRLLVDVFEGWLGLMVVLTMVAGLLPVRRWLPRAALLTGAAALLGLAAINPDAWVAGRNLDRYAETGRIDLYYLQSLSADAAPVVADRMTAHEAGCVLQLLPFNQLSAERSGALDWNLGRARAERAVSDLDLADPASVTACEDVWSRSEVAAR